MLRYRIRLAFGTLLFAVTTAPATFAQSAPEPLRDVLAACGCIVPGMPASLLDTPVLDSQTLSDADGFVVAYRRAPLGRDDRVHVIAGQAATGRWRQGYYGTLEHLLEPKYASGPSWWVRRMNGFILVGLRVANDGIAESILSPELNRLGATYGVVFGVLPRGLVLYERPRPRSAPTAWAELFVLDTKTRQERNVYPPRPFARVRRVAIRREAERYARLGERWCHEMNQHCDPELFDSDAWPFDGGAASNEKVNAFAFGVRYSFEQGPEDDVDVVVACEGMARLETITCRETPLREWERLFPQLSRQQILVQAAANPRRVRSE